MQPSEKGKLVHVIGGEGSGKSTLLASLKQRHPDAVLVREPGGTDLGLQFRQILFDKSHNWNPAEELVWFTADRLWLASTIVNPKLDEGCLVLSDRSFLDSLGHQCHDEHGLDVRRADVYLKMISQTRVRLPHLVLYVDIDPVIGISRRKGSGTINSFDERALEYHRRVRQAYLDLPRFLAGVRFIQLDGTRTPEQLLNEADVAIIELLHAA